MDFLFEDVGVSINNFFETDDGFADINWGVIEIGNLDSGGIFLGDLSTGFVIDWAVNDNELFLEGSNCIGDDWDVNDNELFLEGTIGEDIDTVGVLFFLDNIGILDCDLVGFIDVLLVFVIGVETG